MTEQIITAQTVSLDVDAGADPAAVITTLADALAAAGRTTDPADLARAALEREAKSATGLPGGIAIPHARTASVTSASLAMARLSRKVDFGAPDGPADLVFLIAAPEGGAAAHMKLLSSLARSLVRPDFVASLREAETDDRVIELVTAAIDPDAGKAATPPAAPAARETPAATEKRSETVSENRPRILAITACPTGIAHTYMAADALKYAAERAGVDFAVETQGSSATTPFDPEVIASADAVIFATDIGVKGKGRFHGKPVIASGVKRAINEPDTMIAEAVAAGRNPDAARVTDDGGTESAEAGSSGVGLAGRTRQALMTGVSYMIPFVAAGGLLIALGFLLAGYEIANSTLDAGGSLNDAAFIALNNSLWDLPSGGLLQYLGAVSFAIGSGVMGLAVPVLAGYISFAIADRPGIAPGFVAGIVSLAVGASFIGALIGGLIAGAACLWISRLPVPQWARGLMPVVVIPLFGSLIVGGLLYLVLGKPLAWLTEQMNSGLESMSGGSAVVLGIVLGLMMCFDLGGPVNKTAYLFATAGIADAATAGPAQFQIMAAVMCAGMVPPLALALATVLRPGLFTEPERENGKAAWLLGASFISEGAIPFAAADPFRVIPSMMAGGALSGALIMAFGVELRAPHGGIFVFFAMNSWVLFLVALLAGTVLSAVVVIAAKQFGRTREIAAADLEAVAA
ncbi:MULTISPECIES: PTS fructose transporter subunit IIABC [Gordonia]|jgi:PTS system fructose-specific IIC component|uniref:PTS lactose transporter subunit IIC n=2 Tax=Gordonia alkanivorans TaxID=84096 RepID=W9DHD6_9ACTN|nr:MULTISPECIES: fructose-specific PTS transporter subunit EIIC [Gordonia]ETA07867.1 PTS lactose transporter subunit IIC [Gordonia alkanivorans CGMCC 6845]MDH3006447.1 fructose-specific PTS transporter subunit EIIC [Gordonia alkanivorans]MDH3009765.1 fructose-specific PTS transporter subunit EIIC [Gordonia alkanivorans]MDH3014206.1 fructose-specific PTS transporter subunit EIIC [Gordonia alkanivorans]MDH3018688.1 fructose-specific PTS transporter subunit EIIC [Gordonia alkanivorans]